MVTYMATKLIAHIIQLYAMEFQASMEILDFSQGKRFLDIGDQLKRRVFVLERDRDCLLNKKNHCNALLC